MAEAVENWFYAQNEAGDWSRDAEAQLNESLPRFLPPHSSLSSVTCVGAMCRIESSHASGDDLMAFMEGLTGDAAPWNGALFTQVVEDSPESKTTVAFLTREGHELPNVTGPSL